MFSYPKDFVYAQKHAHGLSTAEQNCLNDNCAKWFQVPIKDVVFLLEYEKNNPGAFGMPMNNCTCTHCGMKQIINLPGKYDSIRSKNPQQQRYLFLV